MSARVYRALEVLGQELQRVERGEAEVLDAIDELLLEAYALGERRWIAMELNTARPAPVKTLESLDFSFQPSLDRSRAVAPA